MYWLTDGSLWVILRPKIHVFFYFPWFFSESFAHFFFWMLRFTLEHFLFCLLGKLIFRCNDLISIQPVSSPLKSKTARETNFWPLLEVSLRAKKWFHVHFFPCFSLSRTLFFFHGHAFQFFSQVRILWFQRHILEFENKSIICGYEIVFIWKTGIFFFTGTF